MILKKSFLLGITLLIALLPGLSALAQGGGDEVPILGLVAIDRAEVRIGPDFAYDVIGQLPRNASVVVTGRAGDFIYRWDGRQWLQIQYGDQLAWVYARLLRTSVTFSAIPVRGIQPPRNANGRIPEVFDLSVEICSRWQGEFRMDGDPAAETGSLTFTFPEMPGANVYSVILINNRTGHRSAYDGATSPIVVDVQDLPQSPDEYTWAIAPYWTTAPQRYNWQQVCLLNRAGTFTMPRRDQN